MSAQPLLAASRLGFSYVSGEPLIADLSLHLVAGQRIALVGPNGSGKTTLVRLLAGELQPDSGVIAGELPLHVTQHVTAEADARSGGEARLSALRSAFSAAARVLLLDEPTNDLDPDARAHFTALLDDFRGAVLIVTKKIASLPRRAAGYASYRASAGTRQPPRRRPASGWCAWSGSSLSCADRDGFTCAAATARARRRCWPRSPAIRKRGGASAARLW